MEHGIGTGRLKRRSHQFRIRQVDGLEGDTELFAGAAAAPGRNGVRAALQVLQ